MIGRVISMTPAAVRVRLTDGRVVEVRNALPNRAPPGSRVVIIRTDTGEHDLVGRTR